MLEVRKKQSRQSAHARSQNILVQSARYKISVENDQTGITIIHFRHMGVLLAAYSFGGGGGTAFFSCRAVFTIHAILSGVYGCVETQGDYLASKIAHIAHYGAYMLGQHHLIQTKCITEL